MDSIIELFDGKLESVEGVYRLQRTLNKLKGDVSTRLVVHFHGGLVSKKSALEIVDSLYPVYHSAGAIPLFFVWQTGIWDVLKQDIQKIGSDDIFNQVLRRVARFVLAKRPSEMERAFNPNPVQFTVDMMDLNEKDAAQLAEFLDQAELQPKTVIRDFRGRQGGDGLKDSWGLTDEEEAAFRDDLLSDNNLVDAVYDTVVQLEGFDAPNTRTVRRLESPRPIMLSNHITGEMLATEKELVSDGNADTRAVSIASTAMMVIIRHATKVLRHVLARYRENRHHSLYTTIVEEILAQLYIDRIGGHFWKTMKEDTTDAFRAGGGGTIFLQHLQSLWNDETAHKPCVMLVGHSAGSIFIGSFLERADRELPAEAQFDVVLLAPAATFEFWHKQADIIKRRVRRFRLFALSDEAELGYWEVPLVYRGSLLYMVSSLFERTPSVPFDPSTCDVPILGMARYHTREQPYEASPFSNVITQLESFGKPIWVNRILPHLPAAAGIPGACSEAQTHGAFDDDPRTQESLKYLLSTDWQCS
ncbi:hypothetical protein KYK31_22375 [Hymenobacter norwichensis]|nr:hypothetical protein [Hymenobacter norwichensis]